MARLDGIHANISYESNIHLWVDDELGVALGGRAEDVGDLVDLVEVVLAREGGPVAHHLGQAAAHAPHVHALRVAL